ncbi:MAG: winged helix-turn-helix domain-containing protein [Halobacteriaceae archaeon]
MSGVDLGEGGDDAVENPAAVLETLGNKYSAEILGATKEPRSAQDLSDELDVPIATCYRRIESLTEAGLLELEDSVLTDDRRRVDVYRRDVEEIRIEFGDSGFDVRAEEATQVKNKLDDAWRTLSDPD